MLAACLFSCLAATGGSLPLVDHNQALANFCLSGAKSYQNTRIRAQDGAFLRVLLLVDPPTGPDVDCSSNSATYPFPKLKMLSAGAGMNINAATPIAMWLNPADVELMLKGDHWVQISIDRASAGNVVLIRNVDGSFRGVGLLRAILDKPGRPVMLKISAKPDGGLPEGAIVPYDLERMEFWKSPGSR